MAQDDRTSPLSTRGDVIETTIALEVGLHTRVRVQALTERKTMRAWVREAIVARLDSNVATGSAGEKAPA